MNQEDLNRIDRTMPGKGVVVHLSEDMARNVAMHLGNYQKFLWHTEGPDSVKYRQVEKLAGDMCFALNNAVAANRDKNG